MKKLVEVTLGILTAIGGMIDVSNLVANPQAGARFGLSLAWVIVFSTIGMIVYMEMSARVAVLSTRPVFSLIRERLGARVALANLAASFALVFITIVAEIGGVSLILQLVTGFNYVVFVPLVAVVMWFVVWKMPFQWMERLYGVLGLAMLVVVVAVWQLHPDWSHLLHLATHPTIPSSESGATYWYFAVAQVGSIVAPYQVFFFSSGAIEEGWKREDLVVARANILIGFPLGMLLALALMALGYLILLPRSIQPEHLAQTALPVTLAMGRAGLAALILGMFAAVFGASLEAALSAGYMIAQYLGWPYGKYEHPKGAPRFHLVVLGSIVVAMLATLTTIDPIKVTEFVLVFSAASVPLTYFPILVVANDPAYVQDKTNSRFSNFLGIAYLVVFLVISIVAIPLMIWTKLGA